MKNLFALIACLAFGLSTGIAQAPSADLTADEVFEKVVQYYDPDGSWDNYKGSMHLYSIFENAIGQEDLTIDNAGDFYQTTKKIDGKAYARVVKAGKVSFQVEGKEMTPEAVPEALQKEPYQLNENFAHMLKEHHTFHFSPPLALKAAGARPLPEVSRENIFGTDCLAIRFAGLPNNYKAGGYNGTITLYVNPADQYKLHGMLLENGWFKDQKGMVNLYSGEIEVAGLKIPARRLYFHAADNSYGFIDVFETIPAAQED